MRKLLDFKLQADPSRGGPAVIYFQAGGLWFVTPISPRTTDQILLAAHRVKH
jgi:hypothetical protein